MDKRLIALATWAVIAVSGFAIRIDYMLSLSVSNQTKMEKGDYNQMYSVKMIRPILHYPP